MKVLTVANQKGGVGKTTIATNLAAFFAAAGVRTLLIDADSQASASAFRLTRTELGDVVADFSGVEMLTPTLHHDVSKFSSSFDLAIIDTGGRDNRLFRSGIMAANLVLVPLCPSQYDFWGSADTFSAIREIRDSHPQIQVWSCFNLVLPNTRIAQEVLAKKDEFAEGYQVHFMNAFLCARVVYKYTAAEGRAVFEANGRIQDAKATEEFQLFAAEIQEVIHG